MANITKLFTYDLADTYLAQTNNLGKEANWMYEGPDKIWVYVDATTGQLENTGFKTEEEDGPNLPVWEGTKLVEVDCGVNPLFCTLVGASVPVEGDDLTQYTEELPNGATYSRPADPMPDHTYEINGAVYNEAENSWSYAWKQTWVTWDKLLEFRDSRLAHAKKQKETLSDMPAALVSQLDAYISELENLEVTWADYTSDTECIKVQLPENPLD